MVDNIKTMSKNTNANFMETQMRKLLDRKTLLTKKTLFTFLCTLTKVSQILSAMHVSFQYFILKPSHSDRVISQAVS